MRSARRRCWSIFRSNAGVLQPIHLIMAIAAAKMMGDYLLSVYKHDMGESVSAGHVL